MIDTTYFPETCMFSLVVNLTDGTQAEVGVVGREGMLGASLLSGHETSSTESMVQMPGQVLRMSAADFRRELDNSPIFRALMLRYNEALHTQTMQTAACNSRHELEQRLARWLLMAHDRAETDELPLTQEFMAMMLGVHRPSITVIAGVLQRAGMIRYTNGRIKVLDRAGLEAASCECYAAVRSRTAVLLCETLAGEDERDLVARPGQGRQETKIDGRQGRLTVSRTKRPDRRAVGV